MFKQGLMGKSKHERNTNKELLSVRFVHCSCCICLFYTMYYGVDLKPYCCFREETLSIIWIPFLANMVYARCCVVESVRWIRSVIKWKGGFELCEMRVNCWSIVGCVLLDNKYVNISSTECISLLPNFLLLVLFMHLISLFWAHLPYGTLCSNDIR